MYMYLAMENHVVMLYEIFISYVRNFHRVYMVIFVRTYVLNCLYIKIVSDKTRSNLFPVHFTVLGI